MLLTITTTHIPATDLGFLLHKNPDRAQSFDLSFGKAHVFYPEANSEKCTAALLLDVDPVALVRGHKGGGNEPLSQYVNDRPYVASSFLSVAIARVFSTALGGRCRDKPELAELSIPLEASLYVVPSRDGESLIRRLFEPLGYEVAMTRIELNSHYTEWGESRYYTLQLRGTKRISDLLSHLYVLVPTLDAAKHYFIGDAEVEKLISNGEGWLPSHPDKNLIVSRYLKNRRSLVEEALTKLTQEADPAAIEEEQNQEEEAVERRISLHSQRLESVVNALKSSGSTRVLDLGCGEGRLINLLLKDRQFTEIVGMDVSYRALEIAREKLHLDRMAPNKQERLKLIQGSLSYRDRRLEGYDAAAIVEVIEHLDPPRLAAFERIVFECARPGMVAVTTPNVEYNPRFETLQAGKFRHKDHRFEWTRAQFQNWSNQICERFGYDVQFSAIGPVDDEVGAPSQMAVFDRRK